MKILIDTNSVIVAKGSVVIQQENGFKVDDTVYLGKDFSVYDLPDGTVVEINKHKYIDGQILDNPNYSEPLYYENEVLELRGKVSLMQQALDEIILGGTL